MIENKKELVIYINNVSKKLFELSKTIDGKNIDNLCFGGVYGLLNTDLNTIYIGQSDNLKRRFRQHICGYASTSEYSTEAQRERYRLLYEDAITKFWYINLDGSTKHKRIGVESLLIDYLKPKYNKPYYEKYLGSF